MFANRIGVSHTLGIWVFVAIKELLSIYLS